MEPENLMVRSLKFEKNTVEDFDDDEYDPKDAQNVGQEKLNGTKSSQTPKDEFPFFVKPETMPRITLKPSGSSINFKCRGGGFPHPNITWTKNKEAIVRDLGHFKLGKWQLILEDLITTDSGRYECKICNYLGCKNFTYKLEVLGNEDKKYNKSVGLTILV